MGARNQVIKGDYFGNKLEVWSIGLKIVEANVFINSDTIADYTIIGNEMDKGSAIGRGIVGGLLLGPLGLVGGALLHKKIVTLKIVFKDGKKSIIEIDSEMYSQIRAQLEQL